MQKPEPIVIDRYHFKQDYVGYMRNERSHLFLLNIDTEETVQLTDGNFEEFSPSFSPDGKQIAFSSKHGEDPDRHDNSDVYVMDATPGGEARQLTTNPGADASPQWSPDGKSIVFLHGGSPDIAWYGLVRIGIVPATVARPVCSLLTWTEMRCHPDGLPMARTSISSWKTTRVSNWRGCPPRAAKISRLTPAGQVVAEFEPGTPQASSC